MIKVCILTSVHTPFDVRIFHKEAKSLVKAGYDVTLIAQYDKEEIVEGVKIINLQKPRHRIERMIKITLSSFRKAIEVNADIYHLHDPELIPVGLKLKRLGKKIIFDSHEDVPKQFIDKPYLNRPIRWLIARVFAFYEAWACRRFDAIVTATPFIRNKFLVINPRTMDINNFPIIGELDAATPWVKKRNEICYIGGIGSNRGIREIVRACELLQSAARLNLAGRFSEPVVEAEVKAYPGWSRVNELGFLDRSTVRDVLSRSMAGLVTFHLQPNHTNAQPNKMFEYMSAGIPVIASKFPLWREIIEGNKCGLCVDPLDPKAIAAAIDHLVKYPDLAYCMGEHGRQAILKKYNWSIEEDKLYRLYATLI